MYYIRIIIFYLCALCVPTLHRRRSCSLHAVRSVYVVRFSDSAKLMTSSSSTVPSGFAKWSVLTGEFPTQHCLNKLILIYLIPTIKVRVDAIAATTSLA